MIQNNARPPSFRTAVVFLSVQLRVSATQLYPSTVAAAKKYYRDKYDPDAAVIFEKISKTVIHNKSSYIIYVNQMSILIC